VGGECFGQNGNVEQLEKLRPMMSGQQINQRQCERHRSENVTAAPERNKQHVLVLHFIPPRDQRQTHKRFATLRFGGFGLCQIINLLLSGIDWGQRFIRLVDTKGGAEAVDPSLLAASGKRRRIVL